MKGGPLQEADTQVAMGEWSWEAAFHGSVHTATLAVATVLALFVLVLGSFGNGLVLLSALRRRKVRTNFDLLLLNLSSADLLLCVLLAPLYLYTLFADPPAPKVFCGALLFGGTGCGLLSLLSIVAVAVHRQARVVGRAKRSLTWRQTGMVLLGVWLLSGVGAVGATLHAMLDWRESYHNCHVLIYSHHPLLHRFTLFFLGPLVLVSFLVIVVSYAVIARAVRAQSRARTQGLAALYRSAVAPAIYRGKPGGVLLGGGGGGGGGDKVAAVNASAAAAGYKPVDSLIAAEKISPPPKSSSDTVLGLGQERTLTFSKATDPLVPNKPSSRKKKKKPDKTQTRSNSKRTKRDHKSKKRNGGDAGSVRQCHCCSCQAALERENKAVTMCLVVILTLVLCWSPLLVSQFIELATGPSIILLQVKLCGIALVFLNSALDPYMYAQNPGQHTSRSRYGRLFWDVLRCQCADPLRGGGGVGGGGGGGGGGGATRFRTLRAPPQRPLMIGVGGGVGVGVGGGGGPGPPLRSSLLLEVDAPSLPSPNNSPPPLPLVCDKAVVVDEVVWGKAFSSKTKRVSGLDIRGGGGGGCCDVDTKYEGCGGGGQGALLLPGGNNETLPGRTGAVTGQLGLCGPGNVLGSGGRDWRTVLDMQQSPYNTNINAATTTSTATNTTITASSSCRHTCRTKVVLRDVKSLVHKSCCHAGHAPSDQSLVES